MEFFDWGRKTPISNLEDYPTVLGKFPYTVLLDAYGIDGSPYTLDAPPYVDRQSQRTMAPVRFISEALGAEVKWDSTTRQVTVEDSGRVIVLTLGSSKVLVDGTERTMDCAPELLPPGRVFVPLRFVSETLGAQVDYDSATGQIILTRQRQ
ncbi:copper amine oxidase N-terminal domain-containing protein [Pelotomaculum terephthalicicum JT]|uniref:copper amine oxidase N-terminal domain-containing protein n=1 Tax=Pelotomaculum terephthalicicum TaxID=206393 RepID=UPI0009CA332B|nr:copper amine oxidase N-terminal domain-containing protein [Pelotomaculum terephthalicicum]MCG9969960.1 copper amine oxidase N-terminal domain-containing protein [Pelotomaculum terephthalicicum JT]OPX86967.1 MAG: Protease inhibitor precursor [Pelotomaculum sp. PtaB.Bin104]